MERKYEVIWTHTAENDLREVIEYISRDSLPAALKIFNKIKKQAAGLNQTPQRGRVIPELLAQGILLYRELIIPPWRLMYRIGGKKVWVVSFLDSRQNLEDILLKRLTK